MRGVFLKFFLWFWLALVLVELAMQAAILATTAPLEVRVHRFSDNALAGYARASMAVLEQRGAVGLAAYVAELKRTTGIRLFLLAPDGRDVSGRTVPPRIAALAARARRTGDTELDADGLMALKARPATAIDGRRYVLVAGTPVGLLRLLYDAPSAQLVRLLAVLLAAGVVCYALARYVARPLATLRAATRELAAGNLAMRVGSAIGRRKDEFADLGHDFDRMAERIEALMTSERRLLRDISHELRSPLARLNVALGLARQQAGDDQTALDRIEREAERLNCLIGQLLMLARLESGATEPERERVDVPEIVRQVAEDADFEARSRHRAVRIVQTCDCRVTGAPELLRSAIENVVRNAVHHTRDGTTVEIAVRPDGEDPSRVLISVRDHGPGVPESALPHIFRPFYRVGDARDRQTGGVGLGLTIVHRTIVLHGGTIRARNAHGGGLIMELSLPAEIPSPAAPAPDVRNGVLAP